MRLMSKTVSVQSVPISCTQFCISIMDLESDLTQALIPHASLPITPAYILRRVDAQMFQSKLAENRKH